MPRRVRLRSSVPGVTPDWSDACRRRSRRARRSRPSGSRSDGERRSARSGAFASDVDCAGGSGNGPAYVAGPVTVIGSDIYDLDRDGDGIACE